MRLIMNSILVIEKEHSIRMALCYVLEGAGYDVTCIESFNGGYDLLRLGQFDSLIINFEALEKEQLNYLYSFSTPVIFLTDLFGLPAFAAKNLPDFVFQLKLPFALESLLTQVKTALNYKTNFHPAAVSI